MNVAFPVATLQTFPCVERQIGNMVRFSSGLMKHMSMDTLSMSESPESFAASPERGLKDPSKGLWLLICSTHRAWNMVIDPVVESKAV